VLEEKSVIVEYGESQPFTSNVLYGLVFRLLFAIVNTLSWLKPVSKTAQPQVRYYLLEKLNLKFSYVDFPSQTLW
jgi:hypothetical protein